MFLDIHILNRKAQEVLSILVQQVPIIENLLKTSETCSIAKNPPYHKELDSSVSNY